MSAGVETTGMVQSVGAAGSAAGEGGWTSEVGWAFPAAEPALAGRNLRPLLTGPGRPACSPGLPPGAIVDAPTVLNPTSRRSRYRGLAMSYYCPISRRKFSGFCLTNGAKYVIETTVLVKPSWEGCGCGGWVMKGNWRFGVAEFGQKRVNHGERNYTYTWCGTSCG